MGLIHNEHDPLVLPCGGTAFLDFSSGFSYVCTDCLAVVGSGSMPKSCKDELDKSKVWETLSK